MSLTRLLRWDGASLVPSDAGLVAPRGGSGHEPAADAPSPEDALLVADSWLLSDGRVRALDLHRRRFVRSVTSAAPMNDTGLGAFWTAALAALPRVGSWFPRVEAVAGASGPSLALRIRPAPPLGDSVVLASHTGHDPRTRPAVKGPDLERLLRLRAERAEDGVDEVVILSANGHVVDGTTSAILWWRGGRLFAPSADLARVDSVTAKSIRLLAAATGVEIGEERSTPLDLAHCEVWAVNALHGIRLVTAWRGGPALSVDPRRSTLWRRRLDALARPLP